MGFFTKKFLKKLNFAYQMPNFTVQANYFIDFHKIYSYQTLGEKSKV
jgi:hypothetical protein